MDWVGTDRRDGRAQRRTLVWKRALANLKLTGGSVNGDGTPEGGGTPGNRVWAEIAEQEQRWKNTHHQTKTRAGFVCVWGGRTGGRGRKLGLGGLNLYCGGF